MRLLLDTHALLWWLQDGPLGDDARSVIADPRNSVVASAVSGWESEVKAAAGRLDLHVDVVEEVRANLFRELDLTLDHARVAARLPMHHRDPFDRMLVAQAQIEGLTLVTRDPAIRLYEVATLPA
ncbi:MAG: PIN domain nuclease [Solirubrobacterales bacterium]|nr:MAG: PIN domain nuclease [Solirubrobacterales bacterium]